MSMKDDLIDDILVVHDIAISDVVKYYRSNKSEIDNMMSIFDEKTEHDISMIQTIPLLLNPDNSDKILDFSYPKHYTLEELEQNKISIVTALLYNNPFFVRSCNWCSYVLYKAEQSESEDASVILKPNWGSLLQNHITIPLGAAASSPGWIDIYPPEDENSNLWISYKKKDNTMHFIYRFDETFKFNHACIQIKLKGLFDLEGNEISVVEIDSDLNEFHEISKKIKVIFDSSFEIFEILIKQ